MALAYRKKEFIVESDERGRPILTEDYIREICESNGGYATPSLNDSLHLHFKGFAKVENLQKYKNVKCIFLENNGLGEIQGLEHQKKLRMLHL